MYLCLTSRSRRDIYMNTGDVLIYLFIHFTECQPFLTTKRRGGEGNSNKNIILNGGTVSSQETCRIIPGIIYPSFRITTIFLILPHYLSLSN